METIRNILPDGLPVSVLAIGATILLSVAWSLYNRHTLWPGFPTITVRGLDARKSWLNHGAEVFVEGSKIDAPFQIMTGTGPKIILPNRYAEEIRNLPELNFPKAFSSDFFINYPGFEGSKQSLTHSWLLRDTVRLKLTQSLGLVTNDLVDECICTIKDLYANTEDWTNRLIRDDLLEIVARVSSRVFLGTELCRNRTWLEIAKSYTVDTFALSFIMRLAPPVLRPLTYLAAPHSWRLRKSVKDARRLIVPEVKKRKAAVDAAKAAGVKPPKVADTLGWMYDIAKGEDLDFVSGQLSMTMAAIHTTTESVCRALLDLCKYPEYIQPLRDEIIEVIGREGWAKTSLYKLKLMDSFLKESHRVTPLSLMSMNRYVEKSITLADGTVLPQGARIAVVGDFSSPKVYDEPERFDAARFLKLREVPGQENAWQYVTTSPSHLGFGHGEHACPGRFFASNEIKIILCHLLVKFDWRFVPDAPEPEPRYFDSAQSVRPDTTIQARRRKPEIDIDAL